MGVRKRLYAGLARQLGHPRGLAGRFVATRLNRSNRVPVTAAVDSLGPASGQVVADIGFGGGLGLALLLDRVGPAGKVYGFDISRLAVNLAKRRNEDAVTGGRLVLHEAPMGQLPLADGSLDGIITVNTIYFVADLRQSFTELARALSPTGRLVVGLADPGTMARMPVTKAGFRLRPVAEVEAALAHAGLSVVDHDQLTRGDATFHLLVAAPPGQKGQDGCRPASPGVLTS